MQKDVFLNGEGNAWYHRNAATSDEKVTPDILTLKKYCKNISGNLLEIGCADGRKLNQYAQDMNAYGIDPSQEAIFIGRSKYPNLNLNVGTADQLDFGDETVNVLNFGFCFYLIDRSTLFKVVAEADRVLGDGGILIITDFDPPFPTKRQYHHKAGVFSYKMDYAGLFLSNPFYTLVEKISYSHYGNDFIDDPQERIHTTVLKKNMNLGYIDV